ncbi:hypothetical protein VSDG_03459 [Cytospora chrysosperma]|uniref:Uncharacterized protein n=1 Tax=Cytospora chrysosperma TaxID=252740 RepID=A0A423WA83_CYTCH|nr:hypothetical protein VSDG_03459 [Valsa sordida]
MQSMHGTQERVVGLFCPYLVLLLFPAPPHATTIITTIVTVTVTVTITITITITNITILIITPVSMALQVSARGVAGWLHVPGPSAHDSPSISFTLTLIPTPTTRTPCP